MKKTNKHHDETSVSKLLANPIFYEFRWGINYFYIGVFVLNGELLTSEQSMNDFNFYYEKIHENRDKKISRPMAKYFIFPIYCAHSFSNDIFVFLNGYKRPRRFRIRFHPVFYNVKENIIELRDAVQNDTLFLYPCILLSYVKGVKRAAEYFHLDPKLAAIKIIRFGAGMEKVTYMLDEADRLRKNFKHLPSVLSD